MELQEKNKQKQIHNSLNNALRTINDAENTGRDIIITLADNSEKLKKVSSNLDKTDEMIVRSNRTVSKMQYKSNLNNCIIYSVIIIVVIVFIYAIYIKVNRSFSSDKNNNIQISNSTSTKNSTLFSL